MAPDDHERVKDIFTSAIEIEPELRSAFVEDAPVTEEVKQEVARLLASYDDEFLEEPAVGSVAEALAEGVLRPGQRLGRYTVRGVIGIGGMGEVYLAEDDRLARQVAIKVLPGEIGAEEERLRRFEQEARAASALNHPNILTVFEFAQEGATSYLATEYVEGGTLREMMNEGPVPLNESIEIAVQLATGIEAAHAHGIIHRDIKPENIMIRSDGLIKILDFGLVKLSAGFETAGGIYNIPTRKQLTTPGIIMGTAQYMSPEQARAHTTDARTDIWSLGCVLYEMICGQPPFAGETSADLIAEIVKTRPISLRAKCPNIPKRLEEIINKTLQKDPDDRYQTAKELLAELKQLQKLVDANPALSRANLQPAKRRRILPMRPKKPRTTNKDLANVSSAEYLIWGIKAHWLTTTGIVLFVLGLLGATALLVRNYWLGPKEARIAYADKIRHARQALDASNFPSTKQLLEETKPGIGEEDLRGFEWGYLTRLQAEWEASQPLGLVHVGPVNDVAFSPDGKTLATAGGNATAILWDVSTSDQIKVFSGHESNVVCLKFSPDGTKLATGSFDRTLRLWDVGTGRQVWSKTGLADTVGRLAFSPDGQTLAIESGNERMVAFVAAGTGDEALPSPKLKDIKHPFTWSRDGKFAAGQGPGFSIVVINLKSGRRTTLNGDFGFPVDVEFAPDSRSVLALGSEGTARLWRLPTGQEFRKYTSLTGGIAMSPDGKTVATGGKDVIKLWDVEKGFEIESLRGHTNDVGSLEFSPDGQWIASGSGGDPVARVWNVPAHETRGVLRGHNGTVKGLSFSPDSKLLASASEDKTAKVWDVETERVRLTVKGHSGAVNSTSFSPLGRSFVTAGQDRMVRVWDLNTGAQTLSFDSLLSDAGAWFSPDGRSIATAHFWSGREVGLWDASTGSRRCTFTSGSDGAWAVDFSKDSSRITASAGSSVKLWDTANCAEVWSVDSVFEGQFWNTFLPDGKLIAVQVLNNSRSLKLMQAESMKEISSIIGHEAEITSAELSPRGDRLVTSDREGVIKLWDVTTGQELLSVRTNMGRINAAIFSPDGNTLAAGGDDGTIRLFRSGSFEQ